MVVYPSQKHYTDITCDRKLTRMINY